MIGKPLSRAEGAAKVTGAARYSGDWPAERLAHAALVTSAISSGSVRSVDARGALAIPGVLAVLSCEKPPVYAVDPAAPSKSGAPPVHALSSRRIAYRGQPVALVVAETPERALHAAALVVVRCRADAPIASWQEAKKHSVPAGTPPGAERGSVQKGFAEADVQIDAIYATPFEHHHPIETHTTLAAWNGSRHLTLWDSNQGVWETRERVAEIFGLDLENVRVVSKFVGGGFGSKDETWSHILLAAAAARAVGRPVRLSLPRTAMVGNVGCRGRTEQRIRLGARKDGALTAIDHAAVNATSTDHDFLEGSAFVSRMLYRCPNVRTSHRVVRMSIGTPTWMRAPGESVGTYALECAMDELAVALEIDPIELRMRNYAEFDPDNGLAWSSKSLAQCYRVGADRIGWSRRAPKAPATRDGDALIGLGMATATLHSYRSKAAARMTLHKDGSLQVVSAASEVGAGTYTVMAQIAADATGMPIERVTFDLGDTTMPQAPKAVGSQQSASVAAAIATAAAALRAKLFTLAVSDRKSPLWEASVDALTILDGRIALSASPSIGESLGTLLERNQLTEVTSEGAASPSPDSYSKHAFGAVFCEVKVDPLGQVRVSRVVGAYGVGRVLNEKLARSQIQGGIVMGLGMALTEASVLDSRTGAFTTRDLAEYHIPVNADVPEIDVTFVKEEDPHVGPAGSKGIGELGITGVAAAIANAVRHATGKRVRDLPITPEKLL